MAKRKPTKKYFFSVEGETEKWYLEWLTNTINSTETSSNLVSLDCKIEKSPLRRVKKATFIGKTEFWHLSDYESNDDFHAKQFKNVIDQLKQAKNIGKNIIYKFGYSNYTFDLWIILHKSNCFGHKSHRNQYLNDINHAFHKNFNDMNDYKREQHFKECLNQLTLENVKEAISRAKTIMRTNQENGYTLHQYKGYSFYKENPSLMIHEIIEKILNDCHLL